MESKPVAWGVLKSATASELYTDAKHDREAAKQSKVSGTPPEILRVKRKLEKHPHYSKWPEDKKQYTAGLFADPQRMKKVNFNKFLFSSGELTMTLHLTMVNDGDVPAVVRMGAKYLQVKYGTLHSVLEIGDSANKDTSLLIEWDDGHLVILRNKEQSSYFDFSHVLKLGDGEDGSGMDKEERIDKICQTITNYNTKHDYHLLTRNSQTFVEDVMSAAGAKTDIGEEMQLYLHWLIKGRRSIQFDSHKDLDLYVNDARSKRREMTTDQLEFLVNQYQYFHGREGAGHRCRVEGCQHRNVERLLRGGEHT